jgi:hypothetical protein
MAGRIRRCIGLIAAKVAQGGRQIRLKISVLAHSDSTTNGKYPFFT